MAKKLEKIMGKRGSDFGWIVKPSNEGKSPIRDRGEKLERLFRSGAPIYVRVRENGVANLKGKAMDMSYAARLALTDGRGRIEWTPEEYWQLDPDSGRHYAGYSREEGPDSSATYVILPGEPGKPGPSVKMKPEHAAQILSDAGAFCCLLEEVDPTETSFRVEDLEAEIAAAESETEAKRAALEKIRSRSEKAQTPEAVKAKAKAKQPKSKKAPATGELPAPPELGD